MCITRCHQQQQHAITHLSGGSSNDDVGIRVCQMKNYYQLKRHHLHHQEITTFSSMHTCISVQNSTIPKWFGLKKTEMAPQNLLLCNNFYLVCVTKQVCSMLF
jgi:hypothetical protein